MPAIEMRKMLLPESDLAKAKFLLGFDYGDAMYHVLAFDFGEDGGAIGVWKEGDDFCARVSLNDLAEFNRRARAEYVQG
jgi:hypothetical protein